MQMEETMSRARFKTVDEFFEPAGFRPYRGQLQNSLRRGEPPCIEMRFSRRRVGIDCLFVSSCRFAMLFSMWLSALSPMKVYASSESHTPTKIGTGFEQHQPGPLEKQLDASGEWSTPAIGHATIHVDHQRSGKQSLRLLGGRQRQVVWTLAARKTPVDSLEFWFERWTRRKPFEFRVEMLVDGNWRTLYHDTEEAVVGPFKNRVSVALPSPAPAKLRFSSTTPAGSGVMIDDIVLAELGPMAITKVISRQPVVPVLIRNEVNSVLDVEVVASGSQNAIEVSELRVNLTGTTNLDDIEHVEVYATENVVPTWRDIESNLKTMKPFGKRQSPARHLAFKDNIGLVAGPNHFYVSVKLKPSASLSNRIRARCDLLIADKEREPDSSTDPIHQRIGYAVRKTNDDNCQVFRIPGLATTKNGTLIGVYDVRYRGWGDLPNDIDVGMSRSTDGGQTWEPMKIIMDMGDDPKWRFDGVGDPSILVDENTGTLWVTATWSHGNRSWHGSGPGLEPEETGQFMLVRSDDEGVTWSKPVNITKQIKRPEWSFVLQGPGRGITMQDGTLVFPAQFQDPPDKNRTPHSTIIYSKDRGETWQCGTAAYPNTTESAVVEIEPGVLMLNCRFDLQNRRVVMITRDMGKTWEEHPTSQKSLPEPRACMGSLLGPVTTSVRSNGEASLLLFSNPNVDTGPRRRMTIKASTDLGMTWPTHWHSLIDEGASAGYSCLTMVDDQHVGILFEGSRSHMTFMRLPISELLPSSEDVESARKATGQIRPNVLLIVSEDNGAELGCYGDPYVKTPHLDQLADDGCRFTNAYVPHPVCSASRAAFLTGLYPFQNGQIGLATHRYAMYRAWDNIPSILKSHGYQTGMIGKLHVNPESAFPFDYRAIKGNGFNDRPMSKYVEAAAQFFEKADKPFFLAVNFPDAHFPLLRQQYGLPNQPLAAGDVKPLPFIGVDTPRLRKGTADYYNCLMRLDAGVGMLLRRLERSGKAENTLVIYLGDHGAQFSRGKATCYEGGLKIPMLVRWPGKVRRNTVSEKLVSTVDILPTILDAANLPARDSLPGKSLLPLASGKQGEWRDYLFAERTAYSADSFYPQRTLRDARYKLILNLMPDRTNPVADAYLNHYNSFYIYGTSQAEIEASSKAIQNAYATWKSPPAIELYDLWTDPWEFENLAGMEPHQETQERLRRELQRFREKHNDPLLDRSKLKRLSREHDFVAKNLSGRRYGKSQSWKYPTYLIQAP